MNNRYPYLPEGREFKYVPISDPFMAETKRIRDTLSTDFFHPTGAAIVKDGKVIGIGANQSALKNKKLIELHKNGLCVRRVLKIPSGKKYWLCLGCSSCRHHSETRAVLDAWKKGLDTKGADLYHYGHWWCCKPCWDSMIKAGIKDVYLVDNAEELFKK
jgi:deoxycytidylate deaminase